MSNKQNLKEPPMDGKLLSEIDYGCNLLAKILSDNKREIHYLITNCQKINEYHAAELLVLKNAHNIKNAATELANFIGISEMLLGNIKSDLNEIWSARKDWQRREVVRVATIEANNTMRQQAEIEKERIAKKRAEKKK